MAELLTTGQVAKAAGVAPRTASKWIDSGQLPGYRLPTAQHRHGARRVKRSELLEFLRANGMPTDHLERCVLLVSDDDELVGQVRALVEGAGRTLATEAGTFAAGLVFDRLAPSAVIVDLGVGRAGCLALAESVRRESGDAVRLVAVAAEDESNCAALAAAGFQLIYQRPFDVRGLVEAVTS